jgi:hypothetical protein
MWPNKTMEEVWRWKEEVARDTGNMSLQELLAFYAQTEHRFAEKTHGGKLNLRRLVPPQRRSQNDRA